MVSRKMKTRILELEQLERLQQLDNVVFSSLSYDDVEIPDNAIIYCDPPYKGTKTYRE